MSARGPDRHGHTWGSSEWLSRRFRMGPRRVAFFV